LGFKGVIRRGPEHAGQKFERAKYFDVPLVADATNRVSVHPATIKCGMRDVQRWFDIQDFERRIEL